MQYILLLLSLSFTASRAQSELLPLKDFGTNPGNLKAYYYVPPSIDTSHVVPLLVALHGCTQNAAEIAHESGWNQLADQAGFIVLYPEQRRINNMQGCFNWFFQSDQQRGSGEPASIVQMIETLCALHHIDSSQVYAFGISAGGMTTVNLLITYPEVFEAGASLAGGPYGAAENLLDATSVFLSPPNKTAAFWKEKASNGLPEGELPPPLFIMHAQDDKVVAHSMSTELEEQWLAFYPQATSDSVAIPNDCRISGLHATHYKVNDRAVVTRYSAPTGGHNLPVDPGNSANTGGHAGRFSKDMDCWMVKVIAREWGLLRNDQ